SAMNLTVFQSDKGDCLLLESADKKHRVLVDGGVRRAYTEHVAPAMGALRKAKKRLDVVYVSHIDRDHIAGVLQLLDDEAAWRVHEHQVSNGNPGHKTPSAPRPPVVGAIFHNSFHDQVGKNSGDVQNMLAATGTTLLASDSPALSALGLARQEIAASVDDALKVSQRIKKGQLNIPLNVPADGKLMMVRDDLSPIKLGPLSLHIIGPFKADVASLRTEWNTWLKAHQDIVKKVRAQAKVDSTNMGAASVSALLGPMLNAAASLGREELALAERLGIETAKKLGVRDEVTAPNLASLMFLAEEGGKTLLLTGDGHCDDILKGLAHHGRLDANDSIHVGTLKVQHHGSEHNINKKFCDHVTADNYIFCGNGEHENPELDVIQVIFDRRMANDTRKFKFWFSSSAAVSVSESGQAQMELVEERVAKLAKKSGGRLTNKFISGSQMKVL
ncbi:MAG TPA: MBL fold metallo-hydrolase, partial [Vicinamibacterales bacterium]|nr:MBL fold metallo-hydrolase [Vicinamibacterales bacterium]